MTREVEAQSGVEAAADNTNPNPDPGTPAVVDYETHAAQLRVMLETVAQEVPHFLWYHPATAKALRGGRLVPEAFITSVSDGVTGAASLQTLNTFDASDTGDIQKYKLAYQPTADLFLRVARSLQFSIDSRSASAGLKALQTYYLAKGLGRTAVGAEARDAAVRWPMPSDGRDVARRRRRCRSRSLRPSRPRLPRNCRRPHDDQPTRRAVDKKSGRVVWRHGPAI
jgi:hypothetical protein